MVMAAVASCGEPRLLTIESTGWIVGEGLIGYRLSRGL